MLIFVPRQRGRPGGSVTWLTRSTSTGRFWSRATGNWRYPSIAGPRKALTTRRMRGLETDNACVGLVRQLGAANWLRYAVGGAAYGGSAETIDTRGVCLIRETLARHSGLADFAFAMQGLGSGAITLHGTEEQKRRYLPRVAAGSAIAAFALS